MGLGTFAITPKIVVDLSGIDSYYLLMSSQYSEEAEKAFRAFSRYINSMSMDPKPFVEAMTEREHRTLQQSAFGVFMACIEAWSKQENFDLRNEYTIKMCKKIMEAVKDDWFGRCPYI